MSSQSDHLIKLVKDIEFNRGVEWVLNNLRKDIEVKIHYIFSKNKEKALAKIDELIGDKFVVKSKNNKSEASYECIYDIYKYAYPNENTRGIRCNTVHIDEKLLENDSYLVDNVLTTYARRGNEKERVFYFN